MSMMLLVVQSGYIEMAPRNVRFSNRPVGVKRFQTIELARDRLSYFETEEPIAATI
jgi:hypothetical protein